MEHCAGGDLYTKLSKSKEKRFSEPQAKVLFRKLLSAVNHCHATNIVHRDLKPENIMFSREFTDMESPSELKIIDFGLGKVFDPEKGPSVSGVVGTTYYVAPEVLELKSYGKPCDCWSLGVILFVLLSGHLPFSGERHKDVFEKIKHAQVRFDLVREFHSVSQQAKDLILRLLEKDTGKRLTCIQALHHPWLD